MVPLAALCSLVILSTSSLIFGVALAGRQAASRDDVWYNDFISSAQQPGNGRDDAPYAQSIELHDHAPSPTVRVVSSVAAAAAAAAAATLRPVPTPTSAVTVAITLNLSLPPVTRTRIRTLPPASARARAAGLAYAGRAGDGDHQRVAVLHNAIGEQCGGLAARQRSRVQLPQPHRQRNRLVFFGYRRGWDGRLGRFAITLVV